MTHEQVSALLARYSTAVMKAYRSPENDHPDLEPARQAIIDVLLRQPPEASALSGWQPIETAPSGTSVLCYWPAVQRNDVKHEAYTGQAWQRFGNWFRTRDGYGAPANEVNDPTHWRPLIASPGTDPTPPRGGEPSDVDHLMRALVQQECVLNECEALLKQMLDDDGVDVGFDERLAAYWVSSKALSDWRSRDCQLKQPHEPTTCQRPTQTKCNNSDPDLCCGGGHDGPCNCECHAKQPCIWRDGCRLAGVCAKEGVCHGALATGRASPTKPGDQS